METESCLELKTSDTYESELWPPLSSEPADWSWKEQGTRNAGWLAWHYLRNELWVSIDHRGRSMLCLSSYEVFFVSKCILGVSIEFLPTMAFPFQHNNFSNLSNMQVPSSYPQRAYNKWGSLGISCSRP